ncbi:pyrroloquinoline quinone biosynthesis protein PqqE [Meridianimarinicoccus roseus]|uniref:PqqA peptide cyclase n=1 Tax=Meridianimarinicoccus roseus TaxID=2072018 RepID=A0A2V2LCH2_9RHOB|nr:pyrroloquinoline quinone biosynthesis protein PqqE [Meridianimarinicoccus roseus]PWR00957.1 pyrroloquinoline quinone biosynthesis protein PqqE [Meridianimarinicoccus roseus]
MAEPAIRPPLALLAELTHRCPLACPYCSNPVELTRASGELPTEIWVDIFRQAAAMGVLHVHLSGGEPASRRDLVDLVGAARDAGLYTNLITSGIGITADRLAALDAAGLDHVQLSMQGVRAEIADRVGGYAGGFDKKMQVADMIADRGIPLTLNAVMHRHNLDDLPETLELACQLGARRIEVACVQFAGWALKNRAALQPTRAQVDAAKRVVAEARTRLRGVLAIDFVPPDYYADYPKACMGGWGSTGLNIAPDGKVLPCHAAEIIPGMVFQNAREVPLADIWYGGDAFNAFRGTDWMPETCRSCDRREIDLGGCRCQAMALVGDARAVDPVCRKSPDRGRVDALLAEESVGADWSYRRFAKDTAPAE